MPNKYNMKNKYKSKEYQLVEYNNKLYVVKRGWIDYQTEGKTYIEYGAAGNSISNVYVADASYSIPPECCISEVYVQGRKEQSAYEKDFPPIEPPTPPSSEIIAEGVEPNDKWIILAAIAFSVCIMCVLYYGGVFN